MASEKVIIEIQLDDGTVKRGLARLETDVKKTGKEIEGSFGTAFGRVRAGISRVSDAIGRFKIAIIGALGGAAFAVRGFVNAFADFEKGLIGIGKTTDASGKELAALGLRIQELGRTLPVATDRLLELGRTAGQFGIRGSEDILKFVKTLGQLELATDLAGEEGAQALVRILNVTGQGVKDIDRLGSAIVGLGNNFETTESQIVNITRELVRGIATFGVSAQDAAALGATLSALGVQAESGGTAIQQTFGEINKAVATGNKNLKVFASLAGQGVQEFRDGFNEDAFGTFQKVITGFSKAAENGENLTLLLTDLGLNNKRTLKTLLPLVSGLDKFNAAINRSGTDFRENTALQEEARRAGEALSASFTTLSNRFNELQTALGAKLAPILQNIVKGLSDLFTVVTKLVNNSFDEFIKSLQEIVRVLGIFLVLANSGAIISGLAAGIAALSSAYRQLRLVLVATNVALGISNVGFASAIKAVRKLPIVLNAARVAANLFKASLTLGLSLALDFVIEKLFFVNEALADTVTRFEDLSRFEKIQKLTDEIDKLEEQIRSAKPDEFIEGLVSIGEGAEAQVTTIGLLTKALDDLKKQRDALKGGLLPTGKDGSDPGGGGGDAVESVVENFDRIKKALDDIINESRNRLFTAAETDLINLEQDLVKGLLTEEQFAERRVAIAKGVQAQLAEVARQQSRAQQVAGAVSTATNKLVAGSFSRLGAALGGAKGGFQDFGKFVLGVLGDLLINIGTAIVTTAEAIEALKASIAGPLGSGGLAIAAGLGLITLGGFLKAIGSGGLGVPGGEGGASTAPTPVTEVPETVTGDEEFSQNSQVTVQIQGDVFDSDSTGTRIAEILSNSFSAEGVEVVRA